MAQSEAMQLHFLLNTLMTGALLSENIPVNEKCWKIDIIHEVSFRVKETINCLQDITKVSGWCLDISLQPQQRMNTTTRLLRVF